MPNCSPKWLVHFVFPSAVYKRSALFASPAAFSIVRPICSLSRRHAVISNGGFSLHFLNEATVSMPRKVHATPPVRLLLCG